MVNLNIKVPDQYVNSSNKKKDPISSFILKYKNHPSITAIKTKKEKSNFSFRRVSIDDIKMELLNLDSEKTTQISDIPTKIIKDNLVIFSIYVHNLVNKTITKCSFPNTLKSAEIKPVHKKDSRNDKGNYRPVSILPNLSKVYEKILYKQIAEFFRNILSKYQTGFRKGFSAQHCLIAMIEKFRKCLDHDGDYVALLTDLSKAFDCLPHDLLIAKLHAYGFDKPSLKLIYNYLTNRQQRVKINNCYSEFDIIKYGVPQGSILGPLLFNIFLCDLFLFVEKIDIASYADDNTPYCTGLVPEKVKSDLEKASTKIFEWFY